MKLVYTVFFYSMMQFVFSQDQFIPKDIKNDHAFIKISWFSSVSFSKTTLFLSGRGGYLKKTLKKEDFSDINRIITLYKKRKRIKHLNYLLDNISTYKQYNFTEKKFINILPFILNSEKWKKRKKLAKYHFFDEYSLKITVIFMYNLKFKKIVIDEEYATKSALLSFLPLLKAIKQEIKPNDATHLDKIILKLTETINYTGKERMLFEIKGKIEK